MYQRPESLSWKKRPEVPYRAPVLICPTHTQRHRRCEVALHMCDFGVNQALWFVPRLGINLRHTYSLMSWIANSRWCSIPT